MTLASRASSECRPTLAPAEQCSVLFSRRLKPRYHKHTVVSLVVFEQDLLSFVCGEDRLSVARRRPNSVVGHLHRVGG